MSVSCLKGIGVYRCNDLYDFASLWIELRALYEQGQAGKCYKTVGGLINDFASFLDAVSPDRARVVAALQSANLSSDLVVVPDDYPWFEETDLSMQ
jgi:hypothetical protein